MVKTRSRNKRGRPSYVEEDSDDDEDYMLQQQQVLERAEETRDRRAKKRREEKRKRNFVPVEMIPDQLCRISFLIWTVRRKSFNWVQWASRFVQL